MVLNNLSSKLKQNMTSDNMLIISEPRLQFEGVEIC